MYLQYTNSFHKNFNIFINKYISQNIRTASVKI